MAKSYGIIGIAAFMLFSAALVSGEETKDVKDTWDNYKIISERNIFSRSRTKVVPVSEIPQQPVIVVPEGAYYTLRGITKQSDEFVSFIEDSRTMNVKKVRKGDKLGPGKVGDITLDDISYVNGGKTLKVKTGMNLEGLASSSVSQYYSPRSDVPQGNQQPRPTGQSPVMGQGPGAGQAQGMGQNQGNAQFPGMGQGQGMGQGPSSGQFSGIGQGQAAGQINTTGQTQSRPKFQQAGQVQSTGQSQPAGQTQTTTRAATQTGQGEQGGDLLQRLKERRKKELEE
jgi:hypothetical protein